MLVCSIPQSQGLVKSGKLISNFLPLNVWFHTPKIPSNALKGPDIPSLASLAAKTPFLAPFGPAQPFHMESSPARV